jgi:hypothetical protein
MFHLPSAVESEREVRNQVVRGRFQGGGGQRAAEVGLMKGDAREPDRGHLGAQPAQRGLVGRAQHDQGVRRRVPPADEFGVGDGEIECRVRRLAGLRAGWKIGSGDQVQARDRQLPERHGSHVTRSPQPHLQVLEHLA